MHQDNYKGKNMSKLKIDRKTFEAIISMYGYSKEEFMETPYGDIYGWSIYDTNLNIIDINKIYDKKTILDLYNETMGGMSWLIA